MESIGIIIAIMGLVIISLYSGSGFYWILSKEKENLASTAWVLVGVCAIWGLAIFSIIVLGHILVNIGGI